MNLEGILSIAGKPGLHKLVAQTKNGLIVESLIDGKRFPINQNSNVSALQDIAIYTIEEEKPLAEVFELIAEKEEYKETISHKESANTLAEYLKEVLPNYDEERVYPSDLKKLFNWYNVLVRQGLMVPSESSDEKEETKEQDA